MNRNALCDDGAAIVPAIPADVLRSLNELADGRFVEPAARARMAKYLRSVLPPPARETHSDNTAPRLVRAAVLHGNDDGAWIEPSAVTTGDF